MKDLVTNRLGLVLANVFVRVPPWPAFLFDQSLHDTSKATFIPSAAVKGMIRAALRDLLRMKFRETAAEIHETAGMQEDQLFGSHGNVNRLRFSDWAPSAEFAITPQYLFHTAISTETDAAQPDSLFIGGMRPHPSGIGVPYEGQVSYQTRFIRTSQLRRMLSAALPLVRIRGAVVQSVIIDQERGETPQTESASESGASGVAATIRQAIRQCIKTIIENPNEIRYLEWRDLERLLAECFERIGFSVILTQGSQDGGKDLILQYTDEESITRTIYVELKHWLPSGKTVGPSIVRKFASVLIRDSIHTGLIISTSGFSRIPKSSIYQQFEGSRLLIGSVEKLFITCHQSELSEKGLWVPSLSETLDSSTLALDPKSVAN